MEERVVVRSYEEKGPASGGPTTNLRRNWINMAGHVSDPRAK